MGKKFEREMPELKSVKTRGQRIDQEEMSRLQALKAMANEESMKEEQQLEPFDRVILSSFQKPRMQLERLWIITNQSRQIMGEEPYPQEKIKTHCDKLVILGYLEYQAVEFEKKTNHVYILTDKGKEEAM